MHYMRWYRHGGPEPLARKIHRRPVGYRKLRADGYILVKVGPGRDEYQLEHRLIAQEMLGRELGTDEHVHHVNGIKDDNRRENLIVLSNAEHQQMHDWGAQRFSRVTLNCARCGGLFQTKRSRAVSSKFCSNACRLDALHESNRKT